MMANYERVVHVAQVDAATLPILCVFPRDTFCCPDGARFVDCGELPRTDRRVDAARFRETAADDGSSRGLGHGCA